LRLNLSDCRDKAGESVANNNITLDSGDISDHDRQPKSKAKVGFAALEMMEDIGRGTEEQEEDFGGLMVRC
jgi:hypothetical protein